MLLYKSCSDSPSCSWHKTREGETETALCHLCSYPNPVTNTEASLQPCMPPYSYRTALCVTHLPVVLNRVFDNWGQLGESNFNSHRYFPQVQETLWELAGTEEIGLWILETSQLKNCTPWPFWMKQCHKINMRALKI